MVNISRRNVLISTAFAGMTGLSGTASAAAAPCSAAMPKKWNYEADVVIIGAGAVGLPAAIGARDAGLSVLVVDANYDIGGHAITSGGNVPLGGGTSFQKKYGIKDSPELVFKDLTDWSIVESGGMPDYRYNDRAVQHALAFNMAPAFEFLLANGVPFVDQAPDNSGARNSVLLVSAFLEMRMPGWKMIFSYSMLSCMYCSMPCSLPGRISAMVPSVTT